ncbi:MAG: heme-binding domain-containing protein [Flavobacteriales bacterium]|nr:heme-binding domain-containing protein [Flavobacteriales bacterium]
MFKRILLALLVLFLLAQFLRPDRSVPAFNDSTDLLAMTNAPDDIRAMLTGACYDCHSYQSTYPWYAAITPVNYWLQDHINEARHEMNFSRWDTYATSKHAPDCSEEVLEGEMPPGNYRFMHAHAQLTPEQQKRLAGWFQQVTGGAEAAVPAKGGEHGEEHAH